MLVKKNRIFILTQLLILRLRIRKNLYGSHYVFTAHSRINSGLEIVEIFPIAFVSARKKY